MCCDLWGQVCVMRGDNFEIIVDSYSEMLFYNGLVNSRSLRYNCVTMYFFYVTMYFIKDGAAKNADGPFFVALDSLDFSMVVFRAQ